MKTKSDIQHKQPNLLGKAIAGIMGKKKDTSGVKTKEGITKVAAEDLIENPLKKVQITSDLEADCITEADTIRQALLDEDTLQRNKQLRETDKRIREERQQQDDTEYFVCIVFEGRSQKEAFLEAMGWTAFGNKYMNGLHLARKQNITLPTIKLKDEKGSKRKMYPDIINHDLK